MRIRKTKTSYTIKANHSEFAALEQLVLLAEGAGKLSGNAKSAYTRRTKGGDFLRVDVDKTESTAR